MADHESGMTLGSVQTERGIIQVEATYQSAERAEMDGYRFAFHSERIGRDFYSISLDDRGLHHSFAVIER